MVRTEGPWGWSERLRSSSTDTRGVLAKPRNNEFGMKKEWLWHEFNMIRYDLGINYPWLCEWRYDDGMVLAWLWHDFVLFLYDVGLIFACFPCFWHGFAMMWYQFRYVFAWLWEDYVMILVYILTEFATWYDFGMAPLQKVNEKSVQNNKQQWKII